MKIGDLVKWRGQTPENKPPDADYGCLGVVIEFSKVNNRLVVSWVDGTIGVFYKNFDDLEVVSV